MTALREPQCDEIAPILVFYVWDEVTLTERERVETHLAICADCKQQLADERLFAELIANNPQAADELDTSGILLAQCRSQLSEALDDMTGSSGRESWRPFGWLSHWMAVRPAWSGALLVLMGVLLGTQILPLLHRTRDNDGGLAVDVKAPPVLTDEQLANMAVAGISFSPAGSSDSGTSVNLQLQAEQPMVVSGNVQDRDVKRVLTYVVRNGEKFNPGVRLDCLDALKAAAHDQEVRHALLTAAQHDPNPAVRMKALEALSRSPIDDSSREALLNVLERDANPGVRVVAVNLLVRSLGQDNEDANGIPGTIVGPRVTQLPDASMEHVMRTLQELERRDPSQYVRLRSGAALRQISSAEVQ